MNNRHSIAWTRLAAAARRAPAADAAEAAVDAGLAAPAGFATRVVARASLRPGSVAAGGILGAGFERLAARALGLAGACALAFAVWGSMPATAEARSADPAAASDAAYLDPVGDYLAAVQSSS
jgi:hypothetical protein